MTPSVPSRHTAVAFAVVMVSVACAPAPTGTPPATDGPMIRESFEFKGCVQPGFGTRALMGGGVIYNRGDKPVTLEGLRLLATSNMTLVDSFVVHGVDPAGGIQSTYPMRVKRADLTPKQWATRGPVAGQVVPPGGNIEVGLTVKAANPKEVARFANYELIYSSGDQRFVDTEPAGLIIGDADCRDEAWH